MSETQNEKPKRERNNNRPNRTHVKIEIEPIENPQKDWKFYTKEEITIDLELPKLPEKPHFMTEVEKNSKIDEIDTKILSQRSERDKLQGQLAEVMAVLKKQKPDQVIQAENKRKEQLEIKKKHIDTLNKLKFQKKDIRDKMSSFDDQKPDKMKRNVGSNMPKDEEDLNKMIEYWENMLQTRSLKTKDEEDIMKKLSQLEGMRKSISDYSEISQEVVALKKQLQAVNEKMQAENKIIDSITKTINEYNDIANKQENEKKESTEGERMDSEKIKKKLDENNAAQDKLQQEKQRIIAQQREEKKVGDAYYEVKKNVEFVKRVQESLSRREEERKARDEEEKKRKANQMTEFEVNITQAKQLRNILEPLLEINAKKLKLSFETIQIFNEIKVGSIPNTKKQIPETLKLVDSYIEEQEKSHQEQIKNLKDE